MNNSLKLKRAEGVTNTNPTQEQIESDNYSKGVVELFGYRIVIENPIGSTRKGVDNSGELWSIEMSNTYGYFSDTVGADGEGVDVFIGTNIDTEFDVYVVNQSGKNSKEFDEHKVMFGFESEEKAKDAYLINYQKGWDGFQNIVTLDLKSFKDWVYNSDKTIPIENTKIVEMDYNNLEQDEKVNIINLRGEVIADETLLDLQRQAQGIGSGETLVLDIASPGGSVSEGLLIMDWLNELSGSGVLIVTLVTANAYSIASLIMLAADIKLISKYGKVMVHNPMVPELSYVNANELEKHISSLRELEGFMYELYKVFTGLEENQIRKLMDNETYLSPSEAVQNGFADMVVSVKETPYEMASKQEKQVNMLGTVNILKNIIAKVNGDKFVNQLYYDDGGSTVEIYQSDPAQYQVGDRASIEDGEVVLSDGCKLIIKGGVIQDIIKGEIEAQEEAPIEEIIAPAIEPIAPQEPIGQEEQPIAPQAGEFNTGEAPIEPAIKSKDEMPATVKETVESTISTKETLAQAGVEKKEVVAEVVAPKEEMVSIPAEAFKAMQEEMLAMQEKVATHDEKMKAYGEKMKVDDVEASRFQNATAEAIETLAKNTVSGFKPEAVNKNISNPSLQNIGKNSIFQSLRRKKLA
tara:strand:- start:2935 stop:4842 length:1908 start_codon:yes stop_codon:yes gene_type:complete